MKPLFVIGVTGSARSGKDTFADRLKEQLIDFHKASFADPIKYTLMIGLGLTEAQCYGDEKEIVDPRYGKTPRYMMQTLGTEWGRQLINPDIWVNSMLDYLDRAGARRVVVPDVRFPNEAEFCRTHGLLVHVSRRGVVGDTHTSEIPIEHGQDEVILFNDRDLEHYIGLCDSAIKYIKDNHLQ